MTRANDSLIAQLGFSDPDLQNPVHELVCSYLLTAPGSKQLANHFLPSGWKVVLPTGLSQESSFRTIYLHGERDWMLSRGRGGRRRVIGFTDALFRHRYIREDTLTDLHTGIVTKPEPIELSSPLVVDVMLGEQELGVKLRKFQLIRTFLDDAIDNDLPELKGYRIVVITAVIPTKVELETLSQANVHPMLLGSGFGEYMARREREDRYIPPVSSV